tara:strand:- start:259 stop:453 length:195 start_codon:yes stop_codon:yes gene_type:complete
MKNINLTTEQYAVIDSLESEIMYQLEMFGDVDVEGLYEGDYITELFMPNEFFYAVEGIAFRTYG